MCGNSVGGIRVLLAVPPTNKLILTVVGSRPRFTIFLEVASIAFFTNSNSLKFVVNFLQSQIDVFVTYKWSDCNYQTIVSPARMTLRYHVIRDYNFHSPPSF
jgi:hypothetical protein